MSRRILWVCIVLTLILAGCAPVVRVQPTESLVISDQGQPSPTPAKNPEATPTLSKTEKFGAALLVAEWDDRDREHLVYPIDVVLGEALPGYTPIPLGDTIYHAFSPDRRTLAAFVQGSKQYRYKNMLTIIDLVKWEVQSYEVKPVKAVVGLAFSPGGRRLVIAHGRQEGRLALFDLDQEAITAENSLDFNITRLKFTSKGDGLMLYGTAVEDPFTASERAAGPPRVALLDSRDLSLLWSAVLEGVRDGIYPTEGFEGETEDLHQPGAARFLIPGLAFAPDRDALYVVHPDEEKLSTVDFSGQAIATVAIHTPLSWLERWLALGAGVAHAKIAEGSYKQAAISADGQLLYVLGQDTHLTQDENQEWQVDPTSIDLQVIRTGNGSRLAKVDTEATGLSISSSGELVFLHGWEEDQAWTEVFDPASEKLVSRQDGLQLMPARRLNGEPVLVSIVSTPDTLSQVTVLDPGSLAVLAEWSKPRYLTWISTP